MLRITRAHPCMMCADHAFPISNQGPQTIGGASSDRTRPSIIRPQGTPVLSEPRIPPNPKSQIPNPKSAPPLREFHPGCPHILPICTGRHAEHILRMLIQGGSHAPGEINSEWAHVILAWRIPRGTFFMPTSRRHWRECALRGVHPCPLANSIGETRLARPRLHEISSFTVLQTPPVLLAVLHEVLGVLRPAPRVCWPFRRRRWWTALSLVLAPLVFPLESRQCSPTSLVRPVPEAKDGRRFPVTVEINRRDRCMPCSPVIEQLCFPSHCGSIPTLFAPGQLRMH
jgi:hypothetical protein